MRYRMSSMRSDGTLRSVLMVLCAFSLVHCDSADPGVEPLVEALPVDGAVAIDAGVPEDAQLPIGPATDLPPNELGEIMVLEYHRLGEPEGEFYRSVENFREDLRRLYESGYRPITVRQMLAGDIDVPRGTTPVVFTIDDSSRGQFHFLDDGTVDPNSMFGIWTAFQAQSPGWENGATWCVLPGADHPSNFFGERPSREVPREERETRIRAKVEQLLANDHEICNHTLYHARLDRAPDDRTVQEWIGRGEDSLRVYLPEDYEIVTLALPLGMWPKTRSLAWSGSHDGRPYEYKGVLEVTGGPNVSPFDVGFDPHSINRVIVAPGHLERLLQAYDRDPGRRFVSDGIARVITVPADAGGRVARDRWPEHDVQYAEPTSEFPPSASAGKSEG